MSRKVDLFILFTWPLAASCLSFAANANFLLSIVLFLGVPAMYLSVRRRKSIGKAALFSLLFAVPLTIVVDYIATRSGGWFVPRTLFMWRLFGVIPFEDFIYGFLLVYFIVMFYERFFEKPERELMDRKLRYFASILGIFLIVFLTLLFRQTNVLVIPYAYFWLGVFIILVPTFAFFCSFPRIMGKFAKTAVYFFVLSFIFELTGLSLGQWTFPGVNFIGWISFGGLQFPFEEFLFWFVMTAAWVLSFYEFFDDDRK